MSLWTKLLETVPPNRRSADIEDELAFHLEMRARQFKQGGMEPDESLASLLLACLGLYVMLADFVKARTKEFGIRLTLEATPRRFLVERRTIQWLFPLRHSIIFNCANSVLRAGATCCKTRCYRGFAP